MTRYLTTNEVAEMFGKPEWLARRVVACLDPPVAKFGGKRMVPAERLAEIANAFSVDDAPVGQQGAAQA